MSIHWHPPAPPAAMSIDLRIEAVPLVNSLWCRRPACTNAGETPRLIAGGTPAPQDAPTCHQPLSFEFARPRVVSIPIARPSVRTRSFTFPEPAESPSWDAGETDRSAVDGTSAKRGDKTARRPSPSPPAFGHTRIKPPGDVIKLADRLHYVLQPSLESLLAEGSLAFPAQPFPFQFEGVAFLYPRQAAILADEMGLGKTMQAITALRLLLRRGRVQSVLLVCPKPLVTNWQRELALWAPEVPVMVVEGDQAKRQWQWSLPDVPLRIANYELLLRDRGLLDGLRFDLVVLDESQRIKNRASSTSEVVRSISRRRGWALTGTPVENSAEDLVGIFEFLAPGFLSPDMKPHRMGQSVRDYVLRRTKDQVLRDLPPKLVHDESLELAAEQRESYRLAEEEGVVRLTELGPGATIRHVFELILRLKQICNFDPLTGRSAKLERLEADLEEIAESGRKAIVFSQWVGTIEKLRGSSIGSARWSITERFRPAGATL